MLHEKIDSAWYFNGSVYAKTTAGKRHKFDICADIDNRQRRKTEKQRNSSGSVYMPMAPDRVLFGTEGH